jgi:hypothetical protein
VLGEFLGEEIHLFSAILKTEDREEIGAPTPIQLLLLSEDLVWGSLRAI